LVFRTDESAQVRVFCADQALACELRAAGYRAAGTSKSFDAPSGHRASPCGDVQRPGSGVQKGRSPWRPGEPVLRDRGPDRLRATTVAQRRIVPA